jgi:predicted unusual protein kinase regulating ubiquinone biosynthesis (AarF/ABC1/UbiB family)
LSGKPPSSPLTRLARLGALSTRVAGSYVGRGIAAVFQDDDAKKKALERLHLENASRIVDTMGLLKGAALKLGQTFASLATTLDLPQEVSGILGRLHDQAAPVPWDVVRAEIERELGAPLSQRFSRFDEEPLGTASLAQAHTAALPDGQEVVVKVLHPGIERTVEADLLALRSMLTGARVLAREKAEMDAIFAEIRARLSEELDYAQEAKNIEEFRALWVDEPGLVLPSVHPGWSTARVLTMDRLRGLPIDEFAATAGPAAKLRAGRTLVHLHYRSVLQHRVLHADPHPGNYLFGEDGTVGLLDFGCVKRFDADWMRMYAQAVSIATDRDREPFLALAHEWGILSERSAGADDALWGFCLALSNPYVKGRFQLGSDADDILPRVIESKKSLVLHPEIKVDPHMVFLHRALAGNYVLLRKLGYADDFGAILRHYAGKALAIATSTGTPAASEASVATTP